MDLDRGRLVMARRGEESMPQECDVLDEASRKVAGEERIYLFKTFIG